MTVVPHAKVFPTGTRINDQGRLVIGGCDVDDLVREFGTPLYVYDEATMRTTAERFLTAFRSRYPSTQVVYACKAFINTALAKFLSSLGLGFDVVSGGELAVLKKAGVPAQTVHFHGNNKTAVELREAVDWGVGLVVIDSFHEIGLLDRVAGEAGKTQPVVVRVSPGVDPHTHHHTTTGILDSKFGFSIQTGHAQEAIRQTVAAKNLDLRGLHFHLGSPIFELEPYEQAVNVVLEFASRMREEGLTLREFSPGGGFAIAYTDADDPPTPDAYAATIVGALKAGCRDFGLDEPDLIVEPGRAMAGPAGVALYTVGAIKEIPTVRTYVSVDGGMGDNIRPALYDAKYVAVVANRAAEAPSQVVTVAGKYCESGDILVKDVKLAAPRPGDIIAIPASGAYAPSMASTYNLNGRPTIVMVAEGKARLIRRRETYADLMTLDVG